MKAKGLMIWGIEATSAVLLVLLNKVLMTGRLDFRFPTTLTAAHFAWTALATSVFNSCADRKETTQEAALPP